MEAWLGALMSSYWLFEVGTDFLVDNEADGAGGNNPREVWYEALVETLDTFVSEREALLLKISFSSDSKIHLHRSPYLHYETLDAAAEKMQDLDNENVFIPEIFYQAKYKIIPLCTTYFSRLVSMTL